MDLGRRVAAVATLDGLAFGGEMAAALLADGLDVLEDASIGAPILLGLCWVALARARPGRLLTSVVPVPGLVALRTAWERLRDPVALDPLPLAAHEVWEAAGAEAREPQP